MTINLPRSSLVIWARDENKLDADVGMVIEAAHLINDDLPVVTVRFPSYTVHDQPTRQFKRIVKIKDVITLAFNDYCALVTQRRPPAWRWDGELQVMPVSYFYIPVGATWQQQVRLIHSDYRGSLVVPTHLVNIRALPITVEQWYRDKCLPMPK